VGQILTKINKYFFIKIEQVEEQGKGDL